MTLLTAKVPALTWERVSPVAAVARFQAAESFRFSVHATDSERPPKLLIASEAGSPAIQRSAQSRCRAVRCSAFFVETTCAFPTRAVVSL